MVNYLKDITDISQYIGTDPFCAVRINPIRLTPERFDEIFESETSPCEFYTLGRRIANEDKTGLDPLHFAGAYYIQEPSAMSAVAALDIKPNDKVLDCCAAPGGKSTAIAPHCALLVANEFNSQRAKILVGNIERMGISNALILNTDTKNLPSQFSGYFDKVLVDSPCSGEGMFRKHPEILDGWSKELVNMCAERSKQVLFNASRCLKEGGRLVYSTCTYNLEENEKVILDFLESNPDFEIADTGLDFGRGGFLGLDKARRIFIEHGGEGHFVCALKRVSCDKVSYPKPFKLKYKFDFLNDIVTEAKFTSDEKFGVIEFSDSLYALPEIMPDPKGIRIMRAGVKLGTIDKKLFRPEHHLFMALRPECIKNKVEPTDIFAYLKGEETACDAAVWGFCAVTYKGLTVGFGKASGGRLKNHLPKGIRIKKITT